MKEQAYCPQCSDFVDFATVQTRKEMDYEGVHLVFSHPQAICSVCGDIASYGPYDEKASAAFSEALRKEKGIVSLEVIKDLPEKYSIGKRPLSNLLDWGELTYTRFIDGHIPSKPYSDTIEKIYYDPKSYLAVLNANKDRITEVAYRKSLEKTQGLLGFSSYNDKRLLEFTDALVGIARGDISAGVLQKLLYYVQSFGLAFDIPTFNNKPRAWVKGPVYGKIWYLFKDTDFGQYYRQKLKDSFPSVLEDNDSRCLIKNVFLAFGQYSSFALSNMTHIEDPWELARNRADVSDGQWCDEPIKPEDQKRYFREMITELGIDSIENITMYSEYIYKRSQFEKHLGI